MIVKAGDTHVVQWKANMSLAGAAVRIIAQPRSGGAPLTLAADVADAAEGLVSHTLTGELPVDSYRIELEVTRGGEVTTFPNDGYASLIVEDDLD